MFFQCTIIILLIQYRCVRHKYIFKLIKKIVYEETGDIIVSEKSEARIRTRKHREKISSFFKFWRPCFISILLLFFLKRRIFSSRSFFRQLCSHTSDPHTSYSLSVILSYVHIIHSVPIHADPFCLHNYFLICLSI